MPKKITNKNDIYLFRGYFQPDGTLKDEILKKEEIIRWASTFKGEKFNPESKSKTIIEDYNDFSVDLILPGGKKIHVYYEQIIHSDMINIYWLKRNNIPSKHTPKLSDYRNPPSEIKVKPIINDYYAPRIAQLTRIKNNDLTFYISNEEIYPRKE